MQAARCLQVSKRVLLKVYAATNVQLLIFRAEIDCMHAVTPTSEVC